MQNKPPGQEAISPTVCEAPQEWSLEVHFKDQGEQDHWNNT